MEKLELANVARNSSCRALGIEDAKNPAQRAVLAALIRGSDDPDATVLCEPSLARSTTRPPDAVLVDLVAGLHVIEVKGVSLDQIQGIEPGGQFRIQYNGLVRSKCPFAQVRDAMFDVRDAVVRSSPSEPTIPFKYWVVLATISRKQWFEKWGCDVFCPPELLFADDIPTLAQRLHAVGQKALDNAGLPHWPTEEVQSIWRAFGDSSVLFPKPDERKPRPVREGTFGELFDEAAEAYKALSDEQQKLSMQMWEKGPRLVRGVAGSGKTIVLANNLARRLHRSLSGQMDLFEQARSPRFAAVCFNRVLAPFVTKKIDIACRQRTGKPMPESNVDVRSIHRLMWWLARKGLWRYQHFDPKRRAEIAEQYLRDLMYVKEHDPATFGRCAYDAIYVDEGQDFLEVEFRLLKELCLTEEGGEPSLFVFYDDTQSLYGSQRPNWHSLGLNIVGRSHVMAECFRNTRQIVEPTFNVLYGTFATNKANVPTKAFGDIATMEEKKLLQQVDGVWKVGFAKREGLKPKVTVAPSRPKECEALVARLRWLIEEQEVRPEDILVLVYYRNQVDRFVAALESARIGAVEGLHIAINEKDALLHRRGWLTISTVASAKGYDAYCVLLAGANEFPTDVQGRASFYVACTRAIEYLEVFGHDRKGLVAEMEAAVSHLSSASAP